MSATDKKVVVIMMISLISTCTFLGEKTPYIVHVDIL